MVCKDVGSQEFPKGTSCAYCLVFVTPGNLGRNEAEAFRANMVAEILDAS